MHPIKLKQLNSFARADNGKMRAANESYDLKMNIIVILNQSRSSAS